MNIKCIREFDLEAPEIKHVRSAPVKMGEGKEGVLFVYSYDCIDPGEEYYRHPKDTLKIALFSSEGDRLWVKDLGEGVIPGIWFCPVLPLDLDCDGVDEIYFVNNISPDHPFSFVYRKLEALSALTGETIGRWDWPQNTFNDRLSLCYRFYLIAGYSNGEPVLITSQGTYGDMYLQGYGPGMVKKWDKVIPADEPGPRASHLTPVFDFNNDGIDELFWGERLISVEDGHEVICYDRDAYEGHSDIIIPFLNFETEERYLFTCREGDDEANVPRVVCFFEDGRHAWTALEEGHMHYGWLATVKYNGGYRRIVMAMKLVQHFGANALTIDDKVEYYFDAFTGERVEWNIPCKGSSVVPIDINGDGYSEFFCAEGDDIGWFFDSEGNKLYKINDEFEPREGVQVKNGWILKDYPCEQVMIACKDGKVRIYGDTEASGSEIFSFRQTYKGYHAFAQKLMATGYNHYRSNVPCGI